MGLKKEYEEEIKNLARGFTDKYNEEPSNQIKVRKGGVVGFQLVSVLEIKRLEEIEKKYKALKKKYRDLRGK